MAGPPERLETERLVLRKPQFDDASAMFARYANDPDVTRLLGWPRHLSIDATRAFVDVSHGTWAQWPAGPYLVESRESGELLGATGFGFETPFRAATGYVLARDAWGKGYATEALQAVTRIAAAIGVVRLYALCHAEHRASARVLEKCDFACEGLLKKYAEFPNLGVDGPCDVLCYARIL
jgi:ribosomal-protein-alanine N-acetyltransferase